MKRYRLLAAAAFMALAIPAAYADQHATPERMQERSKQMQTMMDQAQQATTPAERQKLMAEHMKTMQEQMAAMRDMKGSGGMTGQNQGGAAMDPSVASHMQTMENMMQQQHLMMTPAK